MKYDSIIEKFRETWLNKMLKQYENINILSIKYPEQVYTLKCDLNLDHTYDVHYSILRSRQLYNIPLCTICNPINNHTSIGELKLNEFITQNYDNEIISNSRSIIYPYELDIFIPNLKIAFEYNGVFWHSDYFKSDNYHINKFKMCEKLGIKLYMVWEDDWVQKKDVIKSDVLNLLKENTRKDEYDVIDYDISIIDNNTYKNFLNENHKIGYKDADIKLGLYKNKELISIISFSKNENNYDIIRFCHKKYDTNPNSIVLLFNFFIEKYNFYKIFVNISNDWNISNVYYKLGFNFSHNTQPNYTYIKGYTRILKEDIKIDELTHKIYDCGDCFLEYFNKKLLSTNELKTI